MKVLFVGEGPHDIGAPQGCVTEPFTPGGVVPALARKVVPAIDATSVALKWTSLVRFHPSAKKQGFKAKGDAAGLIARTYGCAGIVLVVDADRDREDRSKALSAVTAPDLRVACGVAVESIEAWTVGAPEAIAEVLSCDVSVVKGLCVHAPERLYESSGNPELRPSALLSRIAQVANRLGGRALREEIAEKTDVDALARACPTGFAPFAQALREAFADESDARPG